jgi:hypothetical protein
VPGTDPITRAREILELSRSVRKPIPPRDQPAYKGEVEAALSALIAHAENLTAVRAVADEQLEAADADSAVLRQVAGLCTEIKGNLGTVTGLLDALAKMLRASPGECPQCGGTLGHGWHSLPGSGTLCQP